jgi:hypothetical protein
VKGSTRALAKNKNPATAAGGRPVMQNFKTEPTDMEQFLGDKTEALRRGPATVQADSQAVA